MVNAVRGLNPSLRNSSQIMPYCRSQMRAACVTQSNISGSSEATVISTGYLNVATGGSDATVNSRTTSGCASSPGLTRTALSFLPPGAALAVPPANAASGSNALPSADPSSEPAVRASPPSGVPVTTATDFTATGASNTRVRWSSVPGFFAEAKYVAASPSKANWRMWPAADGRDASTTAATGV